MGLAPVVFLVGLLDMRLARTDIGGLLVELDRDPTLDLQAPLARALHDPSLELAYWLPEQDTWADQYGHPIALPSGDQRRSIRLIYRNDEPVAALFFDPALDDEEELLNAVSAAAGIALENGRLEGENQPPARTPIVAGQGALRRGGASASGSNGTCTTAPSNGWSALPVEPGSLENRMTDRPQVPPTAPGPNPGRGVRLPGPAPRHRPRHLSGRAERPRPGRCPGVAGRGRRRTGPTLASASPNGSRSRWKSPPTT